MAEQDICPHLDSIGEVTKEDLLQKSKVGFHLFTVNVLHTVCCAVSYMSLKRVVHHYKNKTICLKLSCDGLHSVKSLDPIHVLLFAAGNLPVVWCRGSKLVGLSAGRIVT